jgi:hypothetical protein
MDVRRFQIVVNFLFHAQRRKDLAKVQGAAE